MSLKSRIKKKAKKYGGKVLDIMGKDPLVGSMITSPSERQELKEIDRATAAATTPYKKTLKDVARARAAGSGTFNYTEQVEE